MSGPKKFPGIGKEKDENMASSVFDKFLTEGKMPAAFAKFIKKKGGAKKDGKNPFAKKDDDDGMDESVFDTIVTASGGSRFRLLKAEQASTPSAFDSLVAGGASATSSFDTFVKTESAEAAALDDKLAKTSALTESLAELKKKILQS